MQTIAFLLRALMFGRLQAFEWLGRKDCARLRIGTRSAILLSSPALIEEVLVHRVDEFVKGPALNVHSRPLLGNGLLTAEGEQHRRQRRLVAPAFAHARVPGYASTMASLARETCDSWNDGAVVNMHREMTRLTLAIVGRTLFDVDLLADADEIAKHITELVQFATHQTRSLWPVSYERDTARNRRARASVDRLNRTIYNMIEQRRRSGTDRGDVLSMLLAARDEDGQALNDEQVRDEAMTLFLAGHETTSNAATWALYLLARHAPVQQAFQEQVRNVLGDRVMQWEDLVRMPLALQILKEAMRLYPPAYIVVRQPKENLELTGGIRVRKGELLGMCEWVMHRKAEYFPDPLRFDPERFTPQNEARIPKYVYFPFGAGRRVCIGNQFALIEGQIILATVMQYASISVIDGRELKGDPLLTLRPERRAWMRVNRV